MKTIAFAALMILASASALPQVSDLNQRRDVVEVILDVIDKVREKIQDGYDPYVLEKAEGSYRFPIPGVFRARASIEDLIVTGASNIVVEDIGYSVMTNKLTFAVAIPEIRVSIGRAEAEVAFLGRPSHRGFLDGRLAVTGLRISGELNVEVDDRSKASVSDVVISTSLGGIESGIHVNIIGYDLSGYVNNFLNKSLPTILNNNADRINRILEQVLTFLLNRIL
ncbi:unnamed protein product [Parnassius mnemosyne]|uniref:Uncharacterized protein n=1 Tax=Parnassius mnemosyne TaxID=213953 RepID=A0AAV1M1F5_9NEOP